MKARHILALTTAAGCASGVIAAVMGQSCGFALGSVGAVVVVCGVDAASRRALAEERALQPKPPVEVPRG